MFWLLLLGSVVPDIILVIVLFVFLFFIVAILVSLTLSRFLTFVWFDQVLSRLSAAVGSWWRRLSFFSDFSDSDYRAVYTRLKLSIKSSYHNQVTVTETGKDHA